MNSLSFASLTKPGVSLTYGEAVALVQQLIASAGAAESTKASVALEHVHLRDDGSVVCEDGFCAFGVAEAGTVLDELLSRSRATRTPGALRYLIARALRVVDAPAFKSIADFSAALDRFAERPRADVLHALFARGMPSATPAVRIDRRSHAPRASEFRRHLREADAALFAYAQRDAAEINSTDLAAGARLQPSHYTDAAADARLKPSGEPEMRIRDVARRLQPSVSAPVHHGAGHRMLAGAAAVMLAFGAGYVIADRSGPGRVVRSAAVQRPPAVAPEVSAPGSARSPEHPLLAARSIRNITPIGALATGAAAASIQPPIEDRPIARAAITNAALAPDVPAHVSDNVREDVSQDDADVSPPLAFDGTAMFSHDGQSGDARHALDSAPSSADDLRVMTIADDGAKNEHVQPSPDGRHIAFDSDRDGERGVYIANRDGTNVQRVSGPGYAAVPTWSPDSTQLSFVRNESKSRPVWNLWLLTVASGQSRRLTAFSSGETWSASWFPDGRRIAYSHDDQVVVRDLVSGAVAEYPSPVGRARVRAPAVSPDGRYVIFQVARSGAWLLDLREGFMRRVPIDSTAEAFAWSPDGRRVAYHSRRDGHWGVWAVTSS